MHREMCSTYLHIQNCITVPIPAVKWIPETLLANKFYRFHLLFCVLKFFFIEFLAKMFHRCILSITNIPGTEFDKMDRHIGPDIPRNDATAVAV